MTTTINNLIRALQTTNTRAIVEAARACISDPRIDATELPVGLGAEPCHTSGVWTWNKACFVVGTCGSDLHAVARGSVEALELGLEREDD